MSYNLIKPRGEARKEKRIVTAKDLQLLFHIYLGFNRNSTLAQETGQKKDRISARCFKLEHEGLLNVMENKYELTDEGYDLLNHIIGYYEYLLLASEI